MDFWAEADAAASESCTLAMGMSSAADGDFIDCTMEDCASEDSEVEAEWGLSILCNKASTAHSRICRLPCGDIHLCDDDCPYTIECEDKGYRVCSYTGRFVSRVCEARTDFSTGRSTWSVDPDANSGVPQNAYRKKRDMGKASSAAFRDADTFDDTVMPQAFDSTKDAKLVSKRGALCVDEAAPEPTAPKRVRTSKKNVHEHDTRRMLMQEAETILTKLMGKPPSHTASKSAGNGKPIDARLLSKELIFEAALKKYLKETLASGGVPSVDDVHNIELAVENVVAEEKRKHRDARHADSSQVWSLGFRQQASHLAVSVWTGACQTGYLSKTRRGADSFRPFCAGVFYAFKRGLTLADGTIIVPQRTDFAEALPSARVIASEPASKSLHASSHRGLCTIHRCLATTGTVNESKVMFANAIRIARGLAVS